mmetsp:Transcript_4150/g.9011  ORF Transcript_4150/g.9011 Transcript_4150/m.9011 type:complete len:107 (+) Transcript_4150:252-572(+)
MPRPLVPVISACAGQEARGQMRILCCCYAPAWFEEIVLILNPVHHKLMALFLINARKNPGFNVSQKWLLSLMCASPPDGGTSEGKIVAALRVLSTDQSATEGSVLF